MTKRAVVMLVALALVLPAAVWAQGKTNFSATWIFDPAKSDPPAGGRRGGGGGGGAGGVPGGGIDAALSTLYIKQSATELTIQGDATYKLDGSEGVNRLPNGEVKTKASWDGAKLVVTSTQSVSMPAGRFDIQMKDVWSLDAGLLTIERTTTTPQGSNTRKLLYNKKSS